MLNRTLLSFLLLCSTSLFSQGKFNFSEGKIRDGRNPSHFRMSPDGTYFAAIEPAEPFAIRIWPRTADGFAPGPLLKDLGPAENAAVEIAISYDGNLIAVAYNNLYVYIIKRTGTTFKKSQVITDSDERIGSLSFSADGSTLAVTNLNQKAYFYKVSNGQLTKAGEMEDRCFDLYFSPTDPDLFYMNSDLYTYKDGKATKKQELNVREEQACFTPDGKFLCLNDGHRTYIFKKQPDQSFKRTYEMKKPDIRTKVLQFSPDGRYLAMFDESVASGKRHYCFFALDGDTLAPEMDFGAFKDGPRAFQWAPDGKQALGSISFESTLHFFKVDGVKASKIFQSKLMDIKTDSVKPPPTNTTNPIVVNNNTPVNNNPPKTTNNIINIFWIAPNPDMLDDKPVVSEKPTIEIQIKVISDKKVTKDDIKIIINGKEQGKNKFNEVNLKESTQDQLFEYTYANAVPLEETADHINKIEVMVNGKKSSKPLKVLYSVGKPNLHVLAIGTSLDLQFPKKDAQDFADLFAKQGGSEKDKLFGSVDVRTLIGKDATTNAIKESIEQYRYDFKTGAIGPRDVMLIFISSHGFIYQDQLRIQGDDFKDLFKETYSVSYNDIISRLKEVNCKKLIFLDACFSGGAKASVTDVNNAIRDLNSQGEGVTTFSSSSNDEFSYEDPKWQNGAFTYSIKEGLAQGKADKDGNGIITINELYEFVSVKVPAIVTEVKGKPQHPTMPVSEMLKNIPVFVVGK